MSCCDEITAIQVVTGVLSENVGLLITLFITGLAGSFTHCIGMCGPIAMNQMSIRLMHTPSHSLTEKQKILCAASIPYYMGKAITYSVLVTALMLFVDVVKQFYFLHYLGALLLIFAAIFFLGAAFSNSFSLLQWIPLSKPIVQVLDILQKKLANYTGLLSLNPFGYAGWIMGLILGLLPCGLVYASIATLIANTDSIMIAALGMFMFGIGTIPALFIISYLGEHIIATRKKVFHIFYFVSMIINASLLLKAALKMITF